MLIPHHATLFIGTKEEGRALCHNLFPSDEIHDQDFETFGIADAKILTALQHSRPSGNKRNVFFICALSLTVEAQNALLKTFEEPRGESVFFLCLRSSENILPTVLSRFVQLKKNSLNLSDSESLDDAKKFCHLQYRARLERVLAIMKDETKLTAVSFIESLIHYIRKSATDSKKKIVLNELVQSRSYMYGRSPATKIVLERIALIIPYPYNE